MYFKPYYLGCLAHASYLIGGSSGRAAVIDPRRDVDEYIADAEAAGLSITDVIETHLHADFVSGHVELAERTGATVHVGARAGAEFEHRPAREGDEIDLGDVRLRFIETPGHTPEGVTVLAYVDGEEAPRMAFTGDTLFIGDVGRPDLAGSRGYTAEQMASMLFGSLRDKIWPLPDSMEIWPVHGAGSACGRALSDERSSTLGAQRTANPALRYVAAGDEEGFVRYAVTGLPLAPAYFAHDAARNRQGAPSIEELLAAARPLEPAEVERLSEEGEAIVLDTRAVAEYGRGHVPGSLNVPLDGKFAPWVGTVLPPGSPIVVVAEEGREEEAIVRLARVGYETVIGWLAGGIEQWKQAGGQVAATPQLTRREVEDRLRSGAVALLDVRTGDEWGAGHVEGAIHLPLSELIGRMADVPEKPLAILCGSGYRSSIACSLLERAGRRNVCNVSGGWEAWQQAT
jgi:glyoxylase-like metal-dependent hydrolase (beta-lactamase superfamily II)